MNLFLQFDHIKKQQSMQKQPFIKKKLRIDVYHVRRKGLAFF